MLPVDLVVSCSFSHHFRDRMMDIDGCLKEDYEFCYCPHNLQASRLACQNDNFCSATVDLDAAKRSLDAATMLGVTEAYHETGMH